jgi:ABC-type multidrug transport system ATPase subunit
LSEGALLRATDVQRRFGRLVAVDGVSFRVGPGEVVGLLGANGAGKTTMIRMLLGLLAVSGGSVELMGRWPDREARSRLGYVPQGLGLYGDLTVAENVRFVAGAYGTPRASVPEPLRDFAGTLVADLPLGLQRQVAFCTALQHEPAVLVLDEPTSGVDAVSAARLWDVIRGRADAGVGVLVTTHSMQEAEQCDRLLLMHQGRLMAQGTAREIVAGTRSVAVQTADWASAFALLDNAGEHVMLSGTSIRVVGSDPATVVDVLARAGVPATATEVPATIEERMLALAYAAESA